MGQLYHSVVVLYASPLNPALSSAVRASILETKQVQEEESSFPASPVLKLPVILQRIKRAITYLLSYPQCQSISHPSIISRPTLFPLSPKDQTLDLPAVAADSLEAAIDSVEVSVESAVGC